MEMIQTNKLAGYAFAGLLLSACGGNQNQPTQEQRAALRKPLFATEHTIIDRRSGAKAHLDAATESLVEEGPDANPHVNKERNAYFGDQQ
jgi:hypothetical protein